MRCSWTLKGPWAAFQPVHFANMPADVNVGILPMTWKGRKPPGTYWCICLSGVSFTEPAVLYKSAHGYQDRGPDLPLFGAVMIAQGLLLPIVRVEKRMSETRNFVVGNWISSLSMGMGICTARSSTASTSFTAASRPFLDGPSARRCRALLLRGASGASTSIRIVP